MTQLRKINYGIDAPKVIRNLLLIGFLLLLLSFFLPCVIYQKVPVSLNWGLFSPGISLIITGFLMLAYAKFGKFKHRNRILNLHHWRGDEQVLDVGTGLGLLMIGAAKKLTTGKAFGIDIFNSYDLSDNTIEQTKTNAELEAVSAKVEIIKENILKTSFNNNSFDLIVSNLCIHNIYKSNDRRQACSEMYRILKPLGEIILSDYKNSGEYKKTLESLGMEVQKVGTYYFDTFPPLTIIKAIKK